MYLIPTFEERVNELFLRGLIPGTIHLSLGQEATEAGTCIALEPDDLATLTAFMETLPEDEGGG